MVEKLLKLRTRPMTAVQVAEKMGFGKNRITTLLARIRWMAKVELGGDCPIGEVDQQVAREFLEVWNMARPAQASPAQEWKPMTTGEGRAVSEAIGKVREAAGGGEG